MSLVFMFILATLVFVIVYAFVKFHCLMVSFKPTTLERALQQVADLISEKGRLEEHIADLEAKLKKK